MRSLTLLTLLASLMMALASTAVAHHRADHGAEDPPTEEPPQDSRPIDVVIGDWYECIGGSDGWIVLDGRVARVSVKYCNPWWGPVLP